MSTASSPPRFVSAIWRLMILAATSPLLALALPPQLYAANFSCGAGNITCLVNAINSANGTATADTITLDGSTFTLSTVHNTTNGPNGLPSITSNITIEGNGSIIERRATATAQFRVFHVSLTGALTLNQVTVRNGSLPAGTLAINQGGGIMNLGILAVFNSTVSGNRAGDDPSANGFGGPGGGISNRGAARIQGTVVRDNRAGNSSGTNSDAGCGGGIFTGDAIIGGTLTHTSLELLDSTVANNKAGDGPLADGRGGGGGGVCVNLNGDLEITRSTLNSNTAGKGFAGGNGGGLFVGSTRGVNITNSTFFDNSAGGTPNDGTKFGGNGGAIDVGSLGATVNITNSTIVHNSPGVTLVGSVVSGKGGAIAVNPAVNDPNTVNVKNTIIAFNAFTFVVEVFVDCIGAVINDLGYNIDTQSSCGFSAPTSHSNTDPQISSSIANRGGATATFGLCTGIGTPYPECDAVSPALDAIPAGVNDCGIAAAGLDLDQRGLPRPADGNGDTTAQCDIGAFEVQATAQVSALGPARLWIGLKNSDDQGTQFDLLVELLRNGTPVASGLKRCITGVTRNSAYATEAIVAFDPFPAVTLSPGDVLALRVSTRIGTTATGARCSGLGGSHFSAAGLRLYYDGASRRSLVSVTTGSSAADNLYLRSDGGVCGTNASAGVTTPTLDDVAPTAANAKCKDSFGITFASGNAYRVIGSWQVTVP
jgi:hypothetical protein